MASLGAFFGAAAGPIAKKVLGALGIGMVTYAGVDIAFSALQSLVTSYWNGMPADIAALLALGGYGQGVGIILASMSARVGMLSLSHLGKVAG